MKIKRMLFLSGGGIWGMFQVKVMQNLCSINIYDYIYGSSVGSLNGYHLSQYSKNKQLEGADNLYNYWTNMDRLYKKNQLNIINGIFSKGVYNTKPLETIIDDLTLNKKTYNNLPIFNFPVTSSKNFKPHYVKSCDKDVKKYLLAGSSIPLIFPTIKINNNKYFDGCLSNHLSSLDLPLNETNSDKEIIIDFVTTYVDESFYRFDNTIDYSKNNIIVKINNLLIHLFNNKQSLDFFLFLEKIKLIDKNITLNIYFIKKNKQFKKLSKYNFYDFNPDILDDIYNLNIVKKQYIFCNPPSN
jgi:predicted patatin/cPLA2 family phospholipase